MLSTNERILTTHGGSLPRPDELVTMMLESVENPQHDAEALNARVRKAVVDVVARQREVGIDLVSDGEMGKIGFANYIVERYAGSGENTTFVPLDMEGFDELASRWFGHPTGQEILPVLHGPMEPRDPASIEREVEDLLVALGDGSPAGAFVTAVTPGQIVFNFPNTYYKTPDAYLADAAAALRPEYEAIIGAGFDLQFDSPDSALACHCVVGGKAIENPRRHVEAGIDMLNSIISDLPSERLRFHVCWGNYPGPHHKDVEFREIVEPVLRCHAGLLYFEAANPRHEHELQMWGDVVLPDDKKLIVGVIDTKTNHVEHPELVAQRLERVAGIVGRERVIAGTDCGFAPFAGMNSCDPQVVWLKLESLVRGAQIASERLWSGASSAAA